MKKTEKNSPAVLVNSLTENTIAKTFVAGNGHESLSIHTSKYINPDKAIIEDVRIYLTTFVGVMEYSTILDCVSSPKLEEYFDEIMPNEESRTYEVWKVEKKGPYIRDYLFYNGSDIIHIQVFRSCRKIGTPPYPFMITVKMSSATANWKNVMQCLTNKDFAEYVGRLIKKTFRPNKFDKL